MQCLINSCLSVSGECLFAIFTIKLLWFNINANAHIVKPRAATFTPNPSFYFFCDIFVLLMTNSTVHQWHLVLFFFFLQVSAACAAPHLRLSDTDCRWSNHIRTSSGNRSTFFAASSMYCWDGGQPLSFWNTSLRVCDGGWTIGFTADCRALFSFRKCPLQKPL